MSASSSGVNLVDRMPDRCFFMCPITVGNFLSKYLLISSGVSPGQVAIWLGFRSARSSVVSVGDPAVACRKAARSVLFFCV